MTLQNKILILLSICLCVILLGCSNSPSQVELAVPEELAFGTETLDIRNCDRNEEMVTTLASQAPVRQQISLSGQATVVATGSTVDIPTPIQAELKQQVESAYQPIFDGAVAKAEEIQFTIPGHKIHMVKIHWVRQVYRSTISFSMDDQTCTASYVYTLETPTLDSFTVMACTA